MNKLEIAPHMLYRAAKSYVEAEDDFDYIQAILLAGSAMYICEPLLKEQGKPTQAMERAERIIKLTEAEFKQKDDKGHQIYKPKAVWGADPLSDEDKERVRKETRDSDRRVYNALKHAGFKRQGIVVKPSDDLDMLAVLDEYQDFRSAAEEIILDAIQDYTNLDFSGEFQPYNLPDEVRRVLHCIYLEEAFE